MQTAALYIRVSTDDQTEYSPDAQKRALFEYAKRNNIIISNEHVFLDEGISGRQAEKRPGFMKMIATAKTKPRPFDLILVHKFDRFARSREDSIVYKSLLRKECGIQVISITEHIEDDKFSVILEAMLEAMAEYYSLNLSEEVKKGMTEKARRGEYQTKAPFGYKMEKGELIIDPDKAKVVNDIYRMYLYGSMSFFGIAKDLNSLDIKTNTGRNFENRTVQYILQNPVYKGYVRWNPNGKKDLREQKYMSENFIVKKGSHDPIISEELWTKVNEKILSEYKPRKSKPNEILAHWLGGVLRCSNCGSILASNGSGRGYQCISYSKGKCAISHSVVHTKIEKAVFDVFKVFIDTGAFTYEVKNSSDNNQKIDILKEKLKKLGIKEDRIKEAYINGIDTMDEYKYNKKRLSNEFKELTQKITDLEKNDKLGKNKNEMHSKLQNVYEVICSDASSSKKNIAIKSVVEKIVYNKRTENIEVFLYMN